MVEALGAVLARELVAADLPRVRGDPDRQPLVIMARGADQLALVVVRNLDPVHRAVEHRMRKLRQPRLQRDFPAERERRADQTVAQAIGALAGKAHGGCGLSHGLRSGQFAQEGDHLRAGPARVTVARGASEVGGGGVTGGEIVHGGSSRGLIIGGRAKPVCGALERGAKRLPQARTRAAAYAAKPSGPDGPRPAFEGPKQKTAFYANVAHHPQPATSRPARPPRRRICKGPRPAPQHFLVMEVLERYFGDGRRPGPDPPSLDMRAPSAGMVDGIAVGRCGNFKGHGRFLSVRGLRGTGLVIQVGVCRTVENQALTNVLTTEIRAQIANTTIANKKTSKNTRIFPSTLFEN